MDAKQLRALRALGVAQEVLEVATLNRSKVIARCLAAGCTQAEVALELDVTRQAINNRIKRAARVSS